MKYNILTIFPEMFTPLRESMLGRASENGIIEFNIINFRDYTKDKHNRVDDTPYGGGAGMILQVDPIISAIRDKELKGKFIYMSPRGKILNEEKARELSTKDEITMICGHYEGIDQRVLDELHAEEISVGDFILTGGELPAMLLIDCVSRFIDGVLSSEESMEDESIYSGLLEYPQYTKPREIIEREVPEVLLSGNHELIRLWRFEQSLRLTKEIRPDLFTEYINSGRKFSKKEKKIIEEVSSDK
ncbi:tRNA (guanosine(37)-N1)-methyltransferase TrmD [Alterileibacterium massiliense]|uniref:tRNA (guanosine(37)-N1)-methyltransferase TrmD n=1 Tax=Alterileibacterium massiliense TaxID=1870997 RepID=UPI0008D9F7C4|nr:tRNA (guanosine(37)-N1)-methyltransferase TrmD [Alterileibacterium massiliense]